MKVLLNQMKQRAQTAVYMYHWQDNSAVMVAQKGSKKWEVKK